MYQLYKERPLIILCIIFANIILSIWCINADPIINNDAVTYLTIAQKLVNGHWDETFTHYSWPFYSIFIAFTAKLLSVEVTTAAYALNTLFATLLSLAFVAIVKDLSANNTAIIIIATVVILFFPSINKYRSFIIRDFGYLACYLWSLYFIVRFCSTLNKQHLLGWLIFAALSCLFRFEGIVFLLIAPYFLLLFAATKIPHRRTILTVISVAILISCVGLISWYLTDKYKALMEIANTNGQDVKSLKDLFFVNIAQNFDDEVLTFADYVSIFISNTGDVFYQILRRMSVIYFLFAIYAYFAKIGINDTLLKKIWVTYILTNLLILISFSFYNHFLVSRYTLATSLTLLLIAPFAINALILKAKKSNNIIKAFTAFIILLLSIEAIDKLNIENKKAYIESSGQWLSENIKPNSKIYTNDKLVAYYAAPREDSNLNDSYSYDTLIRYLDYKKIHLYDYVAYSTISSAVLDTIASERLLKEYGEVIKTIDGYNQKVVLIYQRR